MKTKISIVVTAVIFTFIFLAGNVNAKGTKIPASSYENIKETALELENWMMNDSYWKAQETLFYNVENENALELESWMTNENSWNIFNRNFVTETEKELVLEAWMTEESTWKQNRTFDLETEKEANLAIENWMVTDLVWNR